MGFLHPAPRRCPGTTQAGIPFDPIATICWAFLALLVIFLVAIRDREGVLGCLTLRNGPSAPPAVLDTRPTTSRSAQRSNGNDWRHRTSQAEQVLRELESGS